MNADPVCDVESDRPTRRSVVEQEMVNSLGWLISLRWLAGIAVIAAAVLGVMLRKVPLPTGPIFVTGAAILVYNAAFLATLHRLRRQSAVRTEAFEAFTRFQMLLDWVAMTALVAMSGGIESPAILFFMFHITIASLLLPHHWGFVYVTAPPLLVGFVALAEYAGWLPHVAIVQPVRYNDPIFVGFMLVFFTSACYVLAYCCMTITQRLRRRERELGGLYDGVRDITSTLEITDVMDRIVEAAARVLACKAAAIRLIDPSRSQVEFAASWGLSEAYQDEVPGEYAKSVLDLETLRTGVVHVADTLTDPRVWHPERVRGEGIASMLSVAINGRSGPFGLLRAYGGPGHRFSEDDVMYLQAVAAQGAVAIEHAKAYKLLADLDRDKSRFLRMTTHELRSPVRVTESLLMTLAGGYVGALTAEQAEVVGRAQRRLASLHALVDDLLDLAAGKAAMVAVNRRVVDLRGVVTDVCERFQAVAREKGIGLDVVVPESPIAIWCDPSDAERLVVNLVSNAVKYTRAGRVDVALTQDAERVSLVVRDTGIGIPADALPHLFNEFYRAGNAKAVEESGTGLGLSIVKLLVERYGGHIVVSSQEGHGTVFTVDLSVHVPEDAQAGISSGKS
jgi:signal transduction histidine kinase